MSYSRTVRIMMIVAALALPMGAVAEDSKDAKKKPAAKPAAKAKQAEAKREAPIVITNDMLEQRFGPSSGPAPAPTPAAGPAAATAPKPAVPGAPGSKPAKPGGKAAKPTTPEEKAQRVAAIENELEQLRKRVLSIKNPYLAGVAKASEVESEGSNNVERLAQVQQRIADLEKELAGLRGPVR